MHESDSAKDGEISLADVGQFAIDCIVGTRPNFVKIAPILRALRARPQFSVRLIHTGQHYDFEMDQAIFEELGISPPDLRLKLEPAPGPETVARMLSALAAAFAAKRPDLVVVVGDVHSTLAAALAASLSTIKLAHVEAGLRSFDRDMPEELNRLVVDRLADLLFVTEASGVENLRAEGSATQVIELVGNVMIDTLFASRDRAPPAGEILAEILAECGADPGIAGNFGIVTLHRPSNVDAADKLAGLLDGLARISRDLPLVFAVHPRTSANIARFGLAGRLAGARVTMTKPLSYLRLVGLMRSARVVITDSGGLQEESVALGTPCVTVRDNTERPATLDSGNILSGSDPAEMERAVREVLAGRVVCGPLPALWDGHAAERIADAIISHFGLAN